MRDADGDGVQEILLPTHLLEEGYEIRILEVLGIRVNAVCPSAIDTPFKHCLTKVDYENGLRTEVRYPLERIGKPEEVAATVT